jgi:hypothetical protein
MNSPRIGCLSPLALVSAFITLVILFVAEIISGNSMFTPGELNAQAGVSLGGMTSHSEIGKDCRQCHPPFWSAQTMADLCLDCHVNVQQQIGDPTSMHGILSQGAHKPCQNCHTEHNGPNAALTVMDPMDFPHDQTGYSLAGHQARSDGLPFACGDCHPGGISTMDQQTCIDCHRTIDPQFTDTHLFDFGEGCLACHDGVDIYGDFDHNQVTFPLTGAHLQVNCSGCHINAYTVPDLQNTPTTCEACHLSDDAHAGEFGTQCGVCHSPDGWEPAQFDHSLAEFPLEGEHVDVPCDSCHTKGFKGTPMDCYSCHVQDDEHNGAFGTACETCHNPSDWADATFDHTLAAFKLTGAHMNVKCIDCHVNGVFKGTPQTCAACHADPAFHVGLFAGMACSQCHNTTNWSDARFNLAHDSSCGEVACINHEGATCRDCHTSSLATATCLECHDSNNPTDISGGGGDD